MACRLEGLTKRFALVALGLALFASTVAPLWGLWEVSAGALLLVGVLWLVGAANTGEEVGDSRAAISAPE